MFLKSLNPLRRIRELVQELGRTREERDQAQRRIGQLEEESQRLRQQVERLEEEIKRLGKELEPPSAPPGAKRLHSRAVGRRAIRNLRGANPEQPTANITGGRSRIMWTKRST